jgi:hypothetical protein
VKYGDVVFIEFGMRKEPVEPSRSEGTSSAFFAYVWSKISMNAGKHDPSTSESLRKLQKEAERMAYERAKDRRSEKHLEAKEALSEQRKIAFHSSGNDRLSFGDFYKMTSSVFSYPVYNILLAAFIGGMIYATPPSFDFTGSVEKYVPWGWETLVVLILTAHLIPVLLNVLTATRLKLKFHRLPFTVTGLGILVHRTEGRRFFRKCTLELILEETPGIYETTLREIEATVGKLIAHKASKLSRNKAPDSWKISGNTISGYASWRIAGKIITALDHHLKPIHRELGIVRSVVVSTQTGVPQSSDYFEWVPEGD